MRRRRQLRVSGPVRDELARHLRARYEGRELPWRHWSRLVERLESDAPVVVPAWMVTRFVRLSRSWDDRFVQLDRDGSVVLVEPVRDGVHIVDWAPVG